MNLTNSEGGAERIWVTDHLETPASRSRGLFEAEEDNGCVLWVRLLLFLRQQVWRGLASSGRVRLRALGHGAPRAATLPLLSTVQGGDGDPRLSAVQVVKVFSPLAIGHDSASDKDLLQNKWSSVRTQHETNREWPTERNETILTLILLYSNNPESGNWSNIR